jgi:hypothetical protein
MARPKLGEGVGRFVVSLEDMMELKTIELFIQPPIDMPSCGSRGSSTLP